mmetsp:Transcript_15115/g.43878  ORF Transcript_15115/g.43878 Transcript_15115/m.43878 type:complete len:260 (-) Transcript_15115:470-1249(-)
MMLLSTQAPSMTVCCLVALSMVPWFLPSSFFALSFHPSPPVAPSQRPRWRTGPSSRPPWASLPLGMALGELASPRPPRLEEGLIDAAKGRLPWEGEHEGRRGDEESSAPSDEPKLWENGELWSETRETLVKLWVLPRDMTNGADDDWAAAAMVRETAFLSRAPQLLRLPPSAVVETAKAVMGGFGRDSGEVVGSDSRLPPALLRSEPELLVFPSSYVRGGLELLGERLGKDEAVKVCRDTPGALRAAVEEWIQDQEQKE